MSRPARNEFEATNIRQTYVLACQAAGLTPPLTEQECRNVVARCIKGAKTKAELLAKVSRIHISHAEALNQAADVLGFATGWHGFLSFSKKFIELAPQARETHLGSPSLVNGALVLTDELVATNHYVALYARLLRGLFHALYGDAESGEIALRTVFYKSPYAPKDWTGFSPTGLNSLFHESLAWMPCHFVTCVLARVPVVNGEASAWPALSCLKVTDLSSTSLANRDEGAEVGFGYQGWEHGVASMLDALQEWAQTAGNANRGSSPYRQDCIRRSAAPSTRLACRIVFEDNLRQQMPQTVLEAITVREAINGFVTQFYYGSPEQAESMLHSEFQASRLKRVVFREPIGQGFFLSIFRHKFYSDQSDGGTCHNAEAMLHNAADELVAQVGLVLSAVPWDYSLTKFVGHLDETADNDVQELAISIVDEVVDENLFHYDEWQRLLLVRDWEVRKQDRGQGIGLLLLRAACRTAFKGLPGPKTVAAKVWPMQLAATCREASPGIPEIDVPVKRLQSNWQSKVIDGDVLPRSVEVSLLAGHYPWMQGGDAKRELIALGGCRHRAMLYDAKNR